MNFYAERAMRTRYTKGQERMPPSKYLDTYQKRMDKQFAERIPPPTFTEQDILTIDGNLKTDVFIRAYKRVDPTSSPGFPFLEHAVNREVDEMTLYNLCNRLLKYWIDNPQEMDAVLPTEFLLELMRDGLLFPATVFIKGEATDMRKIARLIFGLSLVINVLARIIFGDYLEFIKMTWDNCTHKVGMDFYTEDGLARLWKSFRNMYANALDNEIGVSDDIQGWDWQGRKWMHNAWHRSYLDRANATPFHRKLQNTYAAFEINSLVLDSDGIIHRLPFYIIFSGKLTTHLQNSDERGALAETDSLLMQFRSLSNIPLDKPEEEIRKADYIRVFDSRITAQTNGDDCNMLTPSIDVDSFPSSELGFVHTDIHEEDEDRFHFSSQLFFEQEGKLHRKPDGVAKVIFNLITTEDPDAQNSLLEHVREHEAFGAIRGIFEKMYPGNLG